MKLRDISAVLLALATLTSSITALVKVFLADKDRAEVYQNTALQSGEQAEDIEGLRARLAALEKEKKP
jgi:hypothetical protein